MIAPPQLLTIAVVVLLGAMSHGPDFAVLLRRTAVSGRAIEIEEPVERGHLNSGPRRRGSVPAGA